MELAATNGHKALIPVFGKGGLDLLNVDTTPVNAPGRVQPFVLAVVGTWEHAVGLQYLVTRQRVVIDLVAVDDLSVYEAGFNNYLKAAAILSK